jgi:hypothetical protein
LLVRSRGRWCAFWQSRKDNKVDEIEPVWRLRTFTRRWGEALHPGREPSETLDRIRRSNGEYYSVRQYQQSPAPLGGGPVKKE